MLLVLALGIGGGLRLALYLGQPFPGFALTWRKEIKMLTVSWTTPFYWPVIVTSKMAINDRIVCIDGYNPSPNSAIYGLESRYEAIQCPNGSRKYAEIFRERFSSGKPTVEFLVDRGGELRTVSDVALVKFTPLMLADIFLPVFILGLGLLVVGAVVYRANSGTEINLVFSLFATLIATLVMSQAYIGRFTDRFDNTGLVALIATAPWIPFTGVVSFHLLGLLTDQAAFLTVARWVRRPYYAVSFAFSLLGVLLYAGVAERSVIGLNRLYNFFSVGSCLLAWSWGVACLAWTSRRTVSRRMRHQALLILLGLVVTMVSTTPYLASIFFNTPIFRYVYSLPYLVLVFVAFLAYAILRYQLFTAKSDVLITLLLVIFGIVIANLVYLTIGEAASFLPILVATLLTAAGLEARRGPTAFFNRLLRREALDYQAVAHFGQQVGGLQQVAALSQAAWDCLAADLDVAHLDVWLLDEERQTLERFHDGQPSGATTIPSGFAERLIAHPNPVHATAPEAAGYCTLLADADGATLWAPLTDRGQAVGLLGLGPRWTGELYDERDVQLIGILARRLALSTLNTRQLERLQTTSRLVLQAEENERRKIARELHDTVLQFLLVLTYGLDDLRERQATIAGEIEGWQDRISREAGQLRNLLSYLRTPELLVQQGLTRSLNDWLEQIRRETALTIEAELAEDVETALSSEAKVAIYRTCREAVHNAVKHARGSRVVVRLHREGQRVCFSIQDDGQGFDLAQALQQNAKGYSSLQDMRIYVESAGGRLEVRTAPGTGTTISGWVPTQVGV